MADVLRWFNSWYLNPPVFLSWWGFWIAILALVVAAVTLPTAFKMFFGQPKLMLYFTGQYLHLSLEIQNVPISNKFLKLLHVERDDTKALSINIYIHGENTNQSDLFRGYIYGDKESRILTFNLTDIQDTHLILPASYYRASTMVIRAGTQGNIIKKCVCDTKGKLSTELKDGWYLMDISVFMGGEIGTIAKYFKVNNHEPWVEWAGGEGKVPIKLEERG